MINSPSTSSQSRHPVWLLAAFWLSVVIALAAVLRRAIALIFPSAHASQASAELDDSFSSHAVLTALHIIPAALFVLAAAYLLLRSSAPHWLERAFFFLGAVTGLTAYAMSFYTIGGGIELSAVLVFNTWFLCSLGRAYWFRLRGDPARKREWITRAVGILLGIATTRPIMGVFFATSARTHLRPEQFFGIAFWIGFSINTVLVELWLHFKRR